MTEKESEVQTRVVEPQSIEVENRSGVDVLVVTDHTGQEFTAINSQAGPVHENKEQYVGGRWKMKYTVSQAGFLNFKRFTEETVTEPLPEKQVDPDDFPITSKTSEKEQQIDRKANELRAAEIVSAKIEAGELTQETPEGGFIDDDDVLDELKKWTTVFEHHGRTGEYPESIEEAQSNV